MPILRALSNSIQTIFTRAVLKAFRKIFFYFLRTHTQTQMGNLGTKKKIEPMPPENNNHKKTPTTRTTHTPHLEAKRG